MNKEKSVIGANEFIDIGKKFIGIPAKIDTGADSSSIWASKIRMEKDGTLKFALFGEGSPHYTGRVFKRTDYKVAAVRSATGEEQIRYRTHFKITLAGRKIKALLNLSDRSRNNFPVLIGSRTISKKFVVDVSKKATELSKSIKTKSLNEELRKDPYQFHKKYVKNSEAIEKGKK